MKVMAFVGTSLGRRDRKDSASLRPVAVLGTAARAAVDGFVHHADGSSDSPMASSDKPGELTYVNIDTFLATF